jgi:hypothetical protein
VFPLLSSKLKLRAAVVLLTGHTTLRAHLYKTGRTERQECRLNGYDKEDSVHCMSLSCPSLYKTRDQEQYALKVPRPGKNEGGQPIKPSG